MRYLIPLTPEPQRFSIVLATVEYRLTVRWCGANEGGWLLDIARVNDTQTLVAGLPITTGCDLLSPYPEHAWGGALWVLAPDDLPPPYSGLGKTAKLIFETEE